MSEILGLLGLATVAFFLNKSRDNSHNNIFTKSHSSNTQEFSETSSAIPHSNNQQFSETSSMMPHSNNQHNLSETSSVMPHSNNQHNLSETSSAMPHLNNEHNLSEQSNHINKKNDTGFSETSSMSGGIRRNNNRFSETSSFMPRYKKSKKTLKFNSNVNSSILSDF